MKYLYKAIFFITIALVFSACFGKQDTLSTISQQKGVLLTNNDLKLLFNDTKVSGENLITKKKFDIDYKNDGTFWVINQNSSNKVLGQWYIDNNELCEFFSTGKMNCNKYYKVANQYYVQNRQNKRIAKIIVK